MVALCHPLKRGWVSVRVKLLNILIMLEAKMTPQVLFVLHPLLWLDVLIRAVVISVFS